MQEMVSIIIPVYNAEKWINETIMNIKEQTYKNYEIILINDCSTDRSKEIIELFVCDNISLISLEKHLGPSVARNKGLEKAKGRYICFQDADDLWNSRKLEKQIKFMQQIGCAFSYTAFEYITLNGRKKVEIPFELEYKNALKDTRILVISAMFDTVKIDKELIKMPDVKAEDVATWWKILKNGYIAYGLNETLVYYRVTEKTESSNKLKSAINRWKVYRKEEKLSFIKSLYYFTHYIIYGFIKRYK